MLRILKRKKEKTPPKTKQKHTHKKRTRSCFLLLLYEFEDEDAFLKVGIVLRQVVYMMCGYWLCLCVSVSQVTSFLQVTLTRQCR